MYYILSQVFSSMRKTGYHSQMMQAEFQDRGMERSGKDGKQMVKFANIWRNTDWQVKI